MHEVRNEWTSRWQAILAVLLLALCVAAALPAPASATLKYGPLQLSGNFETQELIRHPYIDKWQFIQNRNTVRIRIDYDWVQNGKLIDKFEIPFIERSKLYLLYRGVYDGFYDIRPGGNQVGQTRFDDLVGGPIGGNQLGSLLNGQLRSGLYTRETQGERSSDKFENVLREAYIDLKLKDLPLSFRIGRQQVIWGESDQFRLMDIWNPIDVSWHLQQESWDNIRVPLWLIKGLWDMGTVGPLSNVFTEVVYNAFDFQPNQKLAFLPRPWSAFFPDPLRSGQVQQLLPGQYLTPVFDLQGSSFRDGSFKRNPAHAGEVGLRFHAVTPQGIEFTTNYLYARGRGVGANGVLGVNIKAIGRPLTGATATDKFLLDGQEVTVRQIPITAQIEYPYNHIFGITGNYFEGDFTSAVFRLETAYVLNEPMQTIQPSKLVLPAGNFADRPIGYTKTDLWAGMIGFDRPTWIRWLNSKSTWFLSGQFFWNYYPSHNLKYFRGNSGVSETPYFTPAAGQPGHNSNGFGQWLTGPNAGLIERLQDGRPGTDPSGDAIRRWEHLITLAATTFYRGGTVVPFIANAWDPVNDNNETLWTVDYFFTNDLIFTLQQKFFYKYGSKAPSDDPWGAGGRNARRDETGVKVTYQF
jgi:hypothetical protein